MPTLMGRDSDEAQALGEVGHCGVAIDSTTDMSQLFAGIDLGRRHDIDDDQWPGRSYLLHVRRRGRASRRRYQQTLPAPCRPTSSRSTSRRRSGCSRRRPIFDSSATDGVDRRQHAAFQSHQHQRLPHPGSGSHRCARTRFHAGGRIRLRRTGNARGLDVNEFAPRLTFFFDAHIDFFEEIAKFRAARRIWARWMRDEYGATSERAQWLKFHTQTAGVSLTAQQPDNNVVRTTVEALAAVLGGTNSLHTNALDEVLALPTEHAAELALRTQQVLDGRDGRRFGGGPARVGRGSWRR